MRCKNIVGARRFQSFFKAHPVRFHQIPDALQREEGRMAFIHVIDRWRIAQSFQRPQSANPQNNLLANPHVMIAAIKLISNVPMILTVVLRNIRIQKMQMNSAHLNQPDFDMNSS